MIGNSFAICQALGLTLFLATISLTYFDRFGSTVLSMNRAQMAIFLIICLSIFLQLHDDESGTLSGILYTSLLPVTAVALCAVDAGACRFREVHDRRIRHSVLVRDFRNRDPRMAG
jgi:hypothetical protein